MVFQCTLLSHISLTRHSPVVHHTLMNIVLFSSSPSTLLYLLTAKAWLLSLLAVLKPRPSPVIYEYKMHVHLLVLLAAVVSATPLAELEELNARELTTAIDTPAVTAVPAILERDQTTAESTAVVSGAKATFVMPNLVPTSTVRLAHHGDQRATSGYNSALTTIPKKSLHQTAAPILTSSSGAEGSAPLRDTKHQAAGIIPFAALLLSLLRS